MFSLFRILLSGLVSLSLFLGMVQAARAFQHPGIPLTLADLNNVKSNLNDAPWSGGYSALTGDWLSNTNYGMHGPFGYVNRNNGGNYDNEGAWKSDMQAAYNLARMWYFTGDANFAKKSHDILIAWAITQTNYGGIEAAFDLGDYAYRYAGAADILRGTWSGWAAADTTTMSNYFANVFWPDLAIPGLVGQGSQGMEDINAAVAIAVFNDDTNKFNQVLSSFLTDADSGLRASYPNGEVSDTGRDQGHAGLYVINLAWTAEVFWKQGVDVFSVFDNRIHACGEYFTRYNLGYPTPYLPIGAPFWGLFNNIGGAPGSAGLDALSPNILHAAYAVRLGINTPYVDLNGLRGWDEEGFVYYKVADTSTATPPAIANLPATASLSTGLTSADLNGCTPAGSTSYSGGTWTLASGYNGVDPWNYTSGNDTVHFAYKQVTGDFTFIARVDSVSYVSGHDKAGIMLRDSLGTASERVWVAITSASTEERAIAGWSDLPYGSNNSSIASPISRMPYWVKMERVGNRVQTFTSADGASWAPAGTTGFNSLPSTMYVGLFGTSLTTGTRCTAKISNARITGGDNGEALKTPSAPFAVYASPGAGQVPLHWNESFTATNYAVRRSTTNGGPYSSLVTVTNTFYLDKNVAPNTTYYYVVTAANPVGTSTNSLQDNAATQPAPPTPTGLIVLPGNAKATLLWIASAGAASYNVKRSATSGSGYLPVANVTTPHYVNSGLANGTTYYYVVSATNAAGESANSPEASVTPNVGVATALFWSGAVNGNWDTTTANWLNAATAATFADGNTAIFDDAGANTSVSLSASSSPGMALFQNTAVNYTVGGSSISGTGSLIKSGSGSLTLAGANTFSGGTTLNAGQITLGASSSGSGNSVTSGPLGRGTLTLGGGKLLMNAKTLGNNLSAAVGNTTVIDNTGGDGYLDGNLSGGGTVTMQNSSGIGLSLKIAFNAAVDWSGFTGTLNYYAVNGQVFNVFLPASCNLSQATLNTGGGGTPPGNWSSMRTTGITQVGALSGSTCYLDIYGTLQIGNLNTNATFSGYIIDTGGITKVGTGTLMLSGANTYTGPTMVSNGTLLITTKSAANGNYTVANGATLGVTNVSSSSALVSNLAVAAGSTLEFQNATSATTPLIAASNVIVDGSCTVKITGTNGLVAGGTYPLVSYAGTFSGTFTNMQLQMPYGWRGALGNSGNRILLANVAVVSTASSQMSLTPNGQQLQLLWPQDHTGWRLVMNTNLAGTNWLDVSGATSTNRLLISPTNGSVFFRLIYP